jgi:hypothetical protein
VSDHGRPASWLEANQRCLMAAVGVVAARLLVHARRRAAGAPSVEVADAVAAVRAAEAALVAARAAMPAPAAIEALSELARLSPFERDTLLLCAGVELSAEVAELCAAADGSGDARAGTPTFGLALAALPGAHWSALSPAGALRRFRLVELASNDSLTRAPLRIEERVLHHLTGLACLDERLVGLVAPIPAGAALPTSHDDVARRLERLWTPPEQPTAGPTLVQLVGPDRAAARAVHAAACRRLHLRPHAIAAADLPAATSEREGLARLWEREVLLGATALLVELDDEPPEHARAAIAFAERVAGHVAIAAREPVRVNRRIAVRLDVGLPTTEEQHAQWRALLGPRAEAMNGELDRVVSHFRLAWPDMQAAGAALADEPVADASALWEACRRQGRPRLEDLAQRIEPAARWEDLVLPDEQLATLREVATHVRHRRRVYDGWGFAARSARGLGISALFSGQSGTGKTMAAEVLAADLRLDLYRIDLSSVVSKYIGETEKNLRRIFDAAEQGGAILLFDEADALFGKRAEVKDSHDRYANIEVSYLLQKMEAYRGLAILTTNLKSALDTAFLRRVRFVVHFPFPDAVERGELWRRAFPAATPTVALDAARLARLHLAGGNIRNVALHAAFLAADAEQPVSMSHVLRAARAEYVKMENPFTESELAMPDGDGGGRA